MKICIEASQCSSNLACKARRNEFWKCTALQRAPSSSTFEIPQKNGEKTSNGKPSSSPKGRSRLQKLFVVALAVGSAFAMGAEAQPQAVTPPTTPTIITPPVGNTAFAVGHALVGTQGYICLPTSPGASTASWTARGRPPAPKPRFFRVSSGRTSRSSPISSAPIQTHLRCCAKPATLRQRDVAEFLR